MELSGQLSVNNPMNDSAAPSSGATFRRGIAGSGLALTAAVLACVTPSPQALPPAVSPPLQAVAKESAAPATTLAPDPASPPSTVTAPILLVTEPADLARWEEALDLGALLFDSPNSSTKQLRHSPAYRSLVAGIFPEGYANHKFPEKKFPKWWLGHPRTFFTLVGVVNRLDRRDMQTGSCGETRLVYRLESRDESDARRLPAAFNVVLDQPDDGHDCADIAKSWLVDVASLAAPNHPLHPERLSLSQLSRIEVSLRHEGLATSAITGNELSVHEYVAVERTFQRTDFEFEPHITLWKGRGWKTLARFLTNPEFIESVRVGTPDLRGADWYGRDYKPKFSSPSAQDTLLQDVLARAKTTPDVSPYPNVEALSYRMETLSCTGCHRQRSVAGFHLPGAGVGSTLHGGASAHLLAELPWREAYVKAVAEGRAPNKVRKDPHAGPAGGAEHCSTATSPVAHLACSDDAECTPIPGAQFGVCVPTGYTGAGPCDKGDESCLGPNRWFPGGFTARACTGDQPCAAVPTAADLRKCWRDADPWSCAVARSSRFAVDPCVDQSGCRDGYACSTQADAEAGVCIPEAAVPELRSAGHARTVR